MYTLYTDSKENISLKKWAVWILLCSQHCKLLVRDKDNYYKLEYEDIQFDVSNKCRTKNAT